jgi:carboxylesterase
MLINQPFLLKGPVENDHVCLLLHGLGGGVYEMQLLGAYLNQQGLTVQGISYPGHDAAVTRLNDPDGFCEYGDRPDSNLSARTKLKMPASTWQQWYGHILETYQNLSQVYTSISVIGFSTGCPLGLHLAATHPVHKLVMLCPYLSIRYQWYYLLPLEAYLFSIGHLIEDIPRLRLPIKDQIMHEGAQKAAFFQTFNLSSVRSAVALIDQVKTEIPKITAPALIIQACNDTIVDPAGAEFLYQYLGSPIKKLHWLPESDHIITLDLEREEVFAEVGAFLQT